MTENEVFEKLTRIFRRIFDDKRLVIDRNTTADDIDDWDSLEHITLISAVEKEFKIRFTMKEVSSMRNVGEMVDIIISRA